MKNRRQRGQFLILMALTIVSLLTVVGLGIDGGRLYFHWTNVSRAVDAACLAVSSKVKYLSEAELQETTEKIAKFNLQQQSVDISKFLLDVVVERNPASINLVKAKMTGTLNDVPSVLMKLIPGQSKSNVVANQVCPTCYNDATIFSLAPTDFYNLNIECQKTCNFHNGVAQFRIPGTETCCDSTFQVQMGDPVGSCMCAGTAALGPATGYCDPHGGNPGPINPSDPGISGPIWYDRTDMNNHVEACNAECLRRGYTHSATAVNPNCNEETGSTCGMCHCVNKNPCDEPCNPILCPLTCGPKCGDGTCDALEICNCLPDCGPCPSSPPSPSPCPSDAPCTPAAACGSEPVGTCSLGPDMENGVCCNNASPSPPPPCLPTNCCAPGNCSSDFIPGVCGDGFSCCPGPCSSPSPSPSASPCSGSCCDMAIGCASPAPGGSPLPTGTCARPAMEMCCPGPCATPSPGWCTSHTDCQGGMCCNFGTGQCGNCAVCPPPGMPGYSCNTSCGPATSMGPCFIGPAMGYANCCPSPSPSPSTCSSSTDCGNGQCCDMATRQCGPCMPCPPGFNCDNSCGPAGSVGDCFIGPAMGYARCCPSPTPSPSASPSSSPGGPCMFDSDCQTSSGGPRSVLINECCDMATRQCGPCSSPSPSGSPSPGGNGCGGCYLGPWSTCASDCSVGQGTDVNTCAFNSSLGTWSCGFGPGGSAFNPCDGLKTATVFCENNIMGSCIPFQVGAARQDCSDNVGPFSTSCCIAAVNLPGPAAHCPYCAQTCTSIGGVCCSGPCNSSYGTMDCMTGTCCAAGGCNSCTIPAMCRANCQGGSPAPGTCPGGQQCCFPPPPCPNPTLPDGTVECRMQGINCPQNMTTVNVACHQGAGVVGDKCCYSRPACMPPMMCATQGSAQCNGLAAGGPYDCPNPMVCCNPPPECQAYWPYSPFDLCINDAWSPQCPFGFNPGPATVCHDGAGVTGNRCCVPS